MNEVKAYQCDYCSFISASKYTTEDHQKSCERNPANRRCRTCLWSWTDFNSRESLCMLEEMQQAYNKNSLQFNSKCDNWACESDLEVMTACEIIDVIPEVFGKRKEFCQILKKLFKKQEIIMDDPFPE